MMGKTLNQYGNVVHEKMIKSSDLFDNETKEVNTAAQSTYFDRPNISRNSGIAISKSSTSFKTMKTPQNKLFETNHNFYGDSDILFSSKDNYSTKTKHFIPPLRLQ